MLVVPYAHHQSGEVDVELPRGPHGPNAFAGSGPICVCVVPTCSNSTGHALELQQPGLRGVVQIVALLDFAHHPLFAPLGIRSAVLTFDTTETPAGSNLRHPLPGRWGMKGAPPDAYFARGYLGQFIVIVPSLDLVVVRLGISFRPGGDIDAVGKMVGEIAASLTASSGL